MRDTMSGDELAENGWSSIRVRYNSYTASHFEDLDITSIQTFLANEVPEYELVALAAAENYDYALEERIGLTESQ